MNTRITLSLVLLAAITLGIGAVIAQRADARGPKKKPIDFTVTDIAGKELKLSDYRGKVVVVDVWATWCGYCVREIPDMIAYQEKLTKDKTPVQIIGLSADDDKEVVKTFARDHKMNYPVAYVDKKALKALGEVPGLPTKFIIAPNGVVVDRIIGATGRADLEKRVAKQLPKK